MSFKYIGRNGRTTRLLFVLTVIVFIAFGIYMTYTRESVTLSTPYPELHDLRIDSNQRNDVVQPQTGSQTAGGLHRVVASIDKPTVKDSVKFPDSNISNGIITSENNQLLQKIIIGTQRVRVENGFEKFGGLEQIGELSSLIPEMNGNPIRNVILSTWRSGSSFFGDLLNSLPGTYYHFEPLMFLEDIQVRNYSADAINAMIDLLKCNYSHPYYLNRSQFHYNSRLWSFCGPFTPFELCEDLEFLNKFCRLFPIQTMKEVRLRPGLSEILLKEPGLNVKIILLVRYPRGVMASRLREEWCRRGPECPNLRNLCEDMISDLDAAKVLTAKYPERFKVIRYEDLALDPYNMTTHIFKFYGLPFLEPVQKFVEFHTKFSTGTSMSTFRNSKDTAFSWLRNLSNQSINEIQTECKEAMELWGYEQLNTENIRDDDTFQPLSEFPFPIEIEEPK